MADTYNIGPTVPGLFAAHEQRHQEAAKEVERLRAELADRERYWKQVGHNYETKRAAMQQIIDAQQQQIAAQQQNTTMTERT